MVAQPQAALAQPRSDCGAGASRADDRDLVEHGVLQSLAGTGHRKRTVRAARQDARARICPMPIYEYVCMSCECHFEELVGMSDPDPACPDCGKAKVAKQFSTSFAAHGTSGQPSFGGGGCCGGSCGCC
jgi:putative FmdB family regulatory protein